MYTEKKLSTELTGIHTVICTQKKNGKEREEPNVLLQRTEKNARTLCSFAIERENFPFFSIYIEIYIDIYRHIYIEKRTERSFIKNAKERKERNVLL